jgi:hypothetical protein
LTYSTDRVLTVLDTIHDLQDAAFYADDIDAPLAMARLRAAEHELLRTPPASPRGAAALLRFLVAELEDDAPVEVIAQALENCAKVFDRAA